jgi:hypothetical protein
MKTRSGEVKKHLKISSAVVIVALVLGVHRRMENLAARVASLEASVAQEGSFIRVSPQRSDVRLERLEDRVTVVERLLDETIVRQKIELDLRSIRDLPSGGTRF